MTESKLLHEYRWPEFPSLVTRILAEQVTLFAQIIADGETYFTPNEGPEVRWKAESGQYEIYDTDTVMSALDELHRRESNSRGGLACNFNPESIPDFSRLEIELRCFISPDRERGELGRGSSPSPEEPLDPMLIPFSRIRVEDNPAKRKISEYEINTPEYAAAVKVWKKYSKNGALAVTKDLLIAELEKQGFSTPSAKAIDRICRGSMSKGGKKKKN